MKKLSIIAAQVSAAMMLTAMPYLAQAAAPVDMSGNITVATPTCNLQVNVPSGDSVATLTFDQANLDDGTDGVASIPTTARYVLSLDHPACSFGNVSVELPVLGSSAQGTTGFVPGLLIADAFIPVSPSVTGLWRYTTPDGTGTQSRITGAFIGMAPGVYSASTNNIVITNTGTNTTNQVVSYDWSGFGVYSKIAYTRPNHSLTYNASSNAVMRQVWPISGNNSSNSIQLQTVNTSGNPNYLNIPATSLTNVKSMAVELGMSIANKVFESNTINNTAVNNGEQFTGTGQITFTMS